MEGYTGRTMRLLPCACLLACLLPISRAVAQTYTPRQIRFEGGGDRAELLRLTGLTPGSTLSKAEIEAAMAKLADTGAFTELSYTVSSDALVIKLSAAAGATGQALPVRFANLVWWQPEELTRLLEQRVPLFHGELPLTGSLTDRVCEALVGLLADKGIKNAKVEAMQSALPAASSGTTPKESETQGGSPAGIEAIALTMTRPELVVGKISLSGAAPVTQARLDIVTAKLAMEEFQTDVTSRAIRENVGDTERNAGFLDATVDAPLFGAPREDMNGYVLDATAAVHAGELYRIISLDLGTKPPLTEAEAQQAADLRPGQPAGEMSMKVALGSLQHAYIGRGHLDAMVKMQNTRDRTAHTVAMRFAVEPGGLYHLAGVDASALPAETQAAFRSAFAGEIGMEAGFALGSDVTKALSAIGATKTVRAGMRANRAQHTVTVVLLPMQASARSPSVPASPLARAQYLGWYTGA